MQPGTNGSSVIIDHLAADVRRIVDQVGRAPSPATGDAGSGMLRSIAELIDREDQRAARAALEAEILARRLNAGRWWQLAASVVAALAAVGALVKP